MLLSISSNTSSSINLPLSAMLKPFIKTCLFSLPLTLITLSYSYAANAGEIYESFPETIDANQNTYFILTVILLKGQMPNQSTQNGASMIFLRLKKS